MALTEASIPKTAFSSPSNRWEYCVVPFGLQNSPWAFQSLMNKIFQPSSDPSLSIYIDDLVVSSKDLLQADKDVRRILSKLRDHNLKVKLKKCSFLKKELQFLGYIINKDGIKPDPEKLEAMRNIKRPSDKSSVRRFLGACSYYSKFIPKYANHARPLQKLTGNVPFVWENSHEESFQYLKSYLSSNDILIYPDPNKTYYLTVDASTVALAGTLGQMIEGKERPIVFMSRALKPTESRYSAYELELLAIVYCLAKTRTYTLGQKIIVRSDHRPLKWIMTNPKAMSNSRLARWVIALMDYDIHIEHIKGKTNRIADMLSRDVLELKKFKEQNDSEDIQERAKLPCSTLYQIGPIRTGLPVEYIIPNKENYLRLQETDNELIHLHNCLLQDTTPNFPTTGKKLLLTDLVIVENILHVRGTKGQLKLYVPAELRHSVMYLTHQQKGKIHVGKNEMLENLSSKYYWPNLTADVREFTSSCHLCLSTKQGKLAAPPIQTVDCGRSVWDVVHIDILGPLKCTSRLNRYLLNVVCSFSKFCLLYPLKTKSTEEVHKIFSTRIVPIFGAPHKIVSDAGLEFKGKLFQEFCEEWKITRSISSSYHPSFNGKCERTNADIGRMLRTLLHETQMEWDQLIGEIIIAMNNRISCVTGYTPFSVFHSRPPNIPSSMLEPIEDNTLPEIPPKKFVSTQLRINRLRWKEINDRLDKAYNYDQRNNAQNLLVDSSPIGLHDLVYINVPRPGKHKLSLKYPGPYEILEQITPRSYKLKSMLDGHQIVLHEERIVRSVPYVQARDLVSHKKTQTENMQQNEQFEKQMSNIAPQLYLLGEDIPTTFENNNNETNSLPEEPPDFQIEKDNPISRKQNYQEPIKDQTEEQEEEENNLRIDRPRRNPGRKVDYRKLHHTGK